MKKDLCECLPLVEVITRPIARPHRRLRTQPFHKAQLSGIPRAGDRMS